MPRPMRHATIAFPAGPAGLALLLLRASLVAFLVSMPLLRADLRGWPVVAIGAVAFALALGLRTRAAASLSGAVALAATFGSAPPELARYATAALAATALALLGPGALSVDSRLFGRRTVHLSDS